jgi:putative ABC transport system substrate-binding protein
MPVIVFLHPGASEIGGRDVAAFRKGLHETGYIEGQNVTVEIKAGASRPRAARGYGLTDWSRA